MLERWFGLKARGTDVRTEVLGGATTFMTMAYIVVVNPAVLSQAGLDFGAVMTATCLSAALATWVMGFAANYPIAMAPAMGENFFFTRILYGGRVSLAVGIFSTLISLMIGILIGALAGYHGGWLDNLLMRLTDAFLILPVVFVLILFSALLRELPAMVQFRNSVWTVIIAVSFFAWMLPARIARGLFLVLREKEFVAASRALGASSVRLIFRRILPNSIGPLVVSATLMMAYAIITESGLSYLGFGIQPPTPSWGNILESAQLHVYRAPWLTFFPGLMIFITVMTINFIGDGLRDAFDPYVVHEK